MFKEFRARLKFLFLPSDHIKQQEANAYAKGLEEGKDFGKRIAHNYTLAAELPDILNRYSRLQLRIMNKPASYIKDELHKFQEKEVERLKMELQDR